MGIRSFLDTSIKPSLSDQASSRKLIYDHDMVFSTIVKRKEIDQYILFVRKNDQFIIAHWRGYDWEYINSIDIRVDGIIIDLLQSQDQILSLDDIDQHYRDYVFIPKSRRRELREERQLWQDLKLNFMLPLHHKDQELFAFFLFHSQVKSEKLMEDDQLFLAVNAVAQQYHNLYIQHEAKRSAGQYKGFFELVESLVKVSKGERSNMIFTFLSDSVGAVQALMMQRDGSSFVPAHRRELNFVKTYSAADMRLLKKRTRYRVGKDGPLFQHEFGEGPVRLLWLGNDTLLIVKESGLKHVGDSYLETTKAVLTRMMND